MTPLLILTAALAGAPEGRDVGVVERLYKYIVQNHPLGIPSDVDMATIGPLLSSRVKDVFAVGRSCEDDYFRQNREALGDGKPEFGWLEWGFFSGPNESAAPVKFKITKSAPVSSGGRRIVVELTYRDTPATYCCGYPPDPRNTFKWHVAVLVKTEDGAFVIDDVVHDAEGTDSYQWRLSTRFMGCTGGHWVGVRRK